MSGLDDLVGLDALAQAELVRRKAMTPLELVDAAVERIERVNGKVNAVVLAMYEHARALAAQPPGPGPFAGVPFLLKDFLAEYAGFRFTEGTAFLRDFVPTEDTELVRRYKRAGLIVVGKTNTPEMAVGPTTEPRLFGPTRNPWNLARTAGGSSGGAAAAVASGMVPAAHGNDAGGSIRVPAACCGVFGLKPTRGRNPLGPRYGDVMSGLVAEHVLTRSVRDSAALLDATAGPDLGDPYWAAPPARPFLKEIGAPPGRLRIAFTTRTLDGADVHPDCAAAVRQAALLLEGLGHEVAEGTPRIEAEPFFRAFTSVLAVGFTWGIDDWKRRTGREPTAELFEPFVWAFTGRGRQFTGPEYLTAVQGLQAASREIARFFVDHDVWLTPMLGEPPVPLGTFSYAGGDPFDLRRRMAAFTPFTYVANVTGQPAMSVPTFWNADDLPLGTQFVGRFGEEAVLLRLASQIEAAQPWATRRPPVFAAPLA
ncbi:MAG: amidase [Candidatus Rokuibacteriota bacterium]